MVIQVIVVDRKTGDGKYGDVLDVCEELANGDYGSAANALVAVARRSPLYAEALERIRARKQAEAAA